MGEVIKVNQISRNKVNLSANEVNWMQSFNTSTTDIDPTPRKLEIWEIRLDKSQFGNG